MMCKKKTFWEAFGPCLSLFDRDRNVIPVPHFEYSRTPGGRCTVSSEFLHYSYYGKLSCYYDYYYYHCLHKCY